MWVSFSAWESGSLPLRSSAAPSAKVGLAGPGRIQIVLAFTSYVLNDVRSKAKASQINGAGKTVNGFFFICLFWFVLVLFHALHQLWHPAVAWRSPASGAWVMFIPYSS